MRLKYTLCFIRRGNQILLLNRQSSPWMGRWNGVGGKLQPDESPLACVLREVYEETGISLETAQYRGLITWPHHWDEPTEHNGMPKNKDHEDQEKEGLYVYIADVSPGFSYETPKAFEEGILDWKEISWIMNPENLGVASNAQKILPTLLTDERCYEHFCVFENHDVVGYRATVLTEEGK
ncbi:NUDIX hydrolase [Brevibacillus dissolubilis]|uniref:NUDIX hydrolase n=1 Tax=Brevibacillus dissolubilis TaxID=1844116 RepID=UPI0011173BE0|nr:8-oxo-dGTP diphosphatase [Brevibacillus dissolubilis]